jgi:hypothetical protein
MIRARAAIALGALALAPAAAADVVPLADRDHTGVPALDGGSVVYVNQDRSRLRVFEQPLAGGAAAELARVADPDAGRAGWALDAGAAGLALRMYTTGRPRLYAGPRQGPLALVQRRARRGVQNVEQRDLFAVPGGPLRRHDPARTGAQDPRAGAGRDLHHDRARDRSGRPPPRGHHLLAQVPVTKP